MKLPIALLLLLSSSFAQATIMVTFSGTMDGFVNGPFNSGDTYSGSFDLDESVAATGVFNDFIGAVDNFQLDIAGNIFTAENGRLRQFAPVGDDFMSVDFGGTFGTINNTPSGGNVLTSVHFDWRGAGGALYPDPTVIATNLTEVDFGFRRVVFGFNNEFDDQVIQNASQINFGPASAVPVPAAVWLFGSGLIGLFGFSKKKSQVS